VNGKTGYGAPHALQVRYMHPQLVDLSRGDDHDTASYRPGDDQIVVVLPARCGKQLGVGESCQRVGVSRP
jgi:hypothetical protein